MNIGKRVRLIRVAILAFPEGFFAKLLGISRDELTALEAGKSDPSGDILQAISVLTKTTVGWYATGSSPPTINNWGYFQHPFPGIESLGETMSQVIAENVSVVRELVPKALRELGQREYYLADVESGRWMYLVLPFYPNGAVILKLANPLKDAWLSAVQQAGAAQYGHILVNEEIASKIGSPRQHHTDVEEVARFLRRLGLSRLVNAWGPNLATLKRHIWQKDKRQYQEYLTKLAEILNTANGYPNSLPITQYTRDELERLRPLAWKEELGLD